MAVSKYCKLDIMFGNAAITGKGNPTILATEYEEFKRVFDVNVFGVFLCAKHATRVMIPAKKWSIILTSIVASMTYGDIPHAYVASKTAIVGFTKNLCIDLGKHGIRVNCISPLGIATQMLMNGLKIIEKEEVEEFVHEIANLKGAISETNDVAEAVLFLGSDESKYVSGQNLVIDGGYSLTNISE
ncbi:Short-chain dehydrogenase reductase 2a [Forsythia ovata]|uniref:Short-chain dehydrogenase reductase 2a n=1 Tax=Forsythia ovata TaxID=205694 RepID=A0ABD1UWP3_9LAMI